MVMIVSRMELSYARRQAAACSSFLGPNGGICATLLGFDLNPTLGLVSRPWKGLCRKRSETKSSPSSADPDLIWICESISVLPRSLRLGVVVVPVGNSECFGSASQDKPVSSFELKIQPLVMETVVVVGSHRSKHYSRGQSQPSRDFGGFSCCTFESATRVLPSRCSRLCYCYGLSELKSPSFYSDQQQKQRRKRKTISPNTPLSPKGDAFTEKTSCSERWAGPAYSNSPPPSSLPIPTFSLRQKRSVSLELQIPKSDMLHSLSKSAPTSPTRESPSSASNFLFNATIATENLRRILQLDIADD